MIGAARRRQWYFLCFKLLKGITLPSTAYINLPVSVVTYQMMYKHRILTFISMNLRLKYRDSKMQVTLKAK